MYKTFAKTVQKLTKLRILQVARNVLVLCPYRYRFWRSLPHGLIYSRNAHLECSSSSLKGSLANSTERGNINEDIFKFEYGVDSVLTLNLGS